MCFRIWHWLSCFWIIIYLSKLFKFFICIRSKISLLYAVNGVVRWIQMNFHVCLFEKLTSSSGTNLRISTAVDILFERHARFSHRLKVNLADRTPQNFASDWICSLTTDILYDLDEKRLTKIRLPSLTFLLAADITF